MKYLIGIILMTMTIMGATWLPTQVKIDYKSPYTIVDTTKAKIAGMLLFQMPASTHGSCANCHVIEKSGFGHTVRPVGRAGMFDVMMQRFDPDHVVDIQPMRTPSVVNSQDMVNTLTGGELGYPGLNVGVPQDKLNAFKAQNAFQWDGIYTQAGVGIHAHFLESMMVDCAADPFLSNLAMEALDIDRIDESCLLVLIGIYEKSIVTDQAPYYQYKNGLAYDPARLDMDKVALFESKCIDCHSGRALGHEKLHKKLIESDFEGRVRMTGDEADRDVVKVPGLYNLPDAPGYLHNGAATSVYQAIKAHNGKVLDKNGNVIWLTNAEIRSLSSFLRNECYDSNMERYLMY